MEEHFGAKIGFFHSPGKKSNLLISLPGMTSRGRLDYSQGLRWLDSLWCENVQVNGLDRQTDTYPDFCGRQKPESVSLTEFIDLHCTFLCMTHGRKHFAKWEWENAQPLTLTGNSGKALAAAAPSSIQACCPTIPVSPLCCAFALQASDFDLWFRRAKWGIQRPDKIWLTRMDTSVAVAFVLGALLQVGRLKIFKAQFLCS